MQQLMIHAVVIVKYLRLLIILLELLQILKVHGHLTNYNSVMEYSPSIPPQQCMQEHSFTSLIPDTTHFDLR